MEEEKRSLQQLAVIALSVLLGICGAAAAAEQPDSQGQARGDGKTSAVTEGPVALTPALPTSGSESPRAPVTSEMGLHFGQRGRTALTQPQCSICFAGSASVQWTGASGSFHVDRITNVRSSGTSGPLDVKMVLTSVLPVWGQTITSYPFSDYLSFNPLSAGYMYSPVDSGTIAFNGSSMPAGEYWLLMFLREYSSGTWYYADWTQMDKKVSCSGSGCSTINPASSCTEDAYTMCLLGGRYRVTGRWKNQYAGGAQANLQKTKLTDVTGAFWIADANTYEFMIRINTATNNGRAWISILTFTDVEFWVAVTDATNGQSKEYHSDPGNRTLIYDPSFFVYP